MAPSYLPQQNPESHNAYNSLLGFVNHHQKRVLLAILLVTLLGVGNMTSNVWQIKACHGVLHRVVGAFSPPCFYQNKNMYMSCKSSWTHIFPQFFGVTKHPPTKKIIWGISEWSWTSTFREFFLHLEALNTNPKTSEYPQGRPYY